MCNNIILGETVVAGYWHDYIFRRWKTSRAGALSNGGAYVSVCADVRRCSFPRQRDAGTRRPCAAERGALLSSESAVQQYPTNPDNPTKGSKTERAIAF